MLNLLNNFLPKNKRGIYLIGGAVRDQIMGKIPYDFDIVFKGNIHELAPKISEKVNGKIIIIGQKKHKIIRIVSPQITIDIASLKGRNINDDILKRDFTVNAIAYNLSNKNIIDPSNGLEDIKKKKIRMVKNSIFKKDAIRLLRAYRIALNLDFSIEKITRNEIVRHKTLIRKTSGERIWSELFKIFSHSNSTSTIYDMEKSGLLYTLFSATPTLNQNVASNNCCLPKHGIRAYNYIETILSDRIKQNAPILQRLCKDVVDSKSYPLIKCALLLRYTGSPNDNTQDIFNGTSPENFNKKMSTIQYICNYLKLSRVQKSIIKAIIINNIRLMELFKTQRNNKLSKKDKYILFEKCGHTLVGTIIHSLADTLSKRPYLKEHDLELILFLYSLLRQYIEPYRKTIEEASIITGYDLLQHFKIKPSPKFKQILSAIHIAKISGEISTKESALKIAKKYI